MQGHVRSRVHLPENENISGTIDEGASGVKRLCSYIEAESWDAGSPPFCDAPALPASAYCRRHAGQCASAATVSDETEPSYPLFEERDEEDSEPWAFAIRPRRTEDEDGEGER